MRWLRHQLELFFTALGFFTRIPVPHWVPWSMARLNQSTCYFALIGWVVGAVGALSYLVAAWLLPVSVAVVLSMLLTIYLTGAFHEDGLADSCDGLGGGQDRAHALQIMKDSRIGTYGTVALVLALLLKALMLIALAEYDHWLPALALLVAHPLSRLAASTLIYRLDYVREDPQAKAKPVAEQLSTRGLLIAAVSGLLPLALLPLASALAVLLMTLLLTAYAGYVLHRRLGGYTGDCLGATQQVTELGCYLALLVAVKLSI